MFLCAVNILVADADAPPGQTTRHYKPSNSTEATYQDISAQRDFIHQAGGATYVLNGAFDDWSDGLPVDWKLYSHAPKGHELRWSKVDLSNGGSGEDQNYALGLFIRNVHRRRDPAFGAACVKLNVLNKGDYWVTIHTAAWGNENIPYNSMAWYAISTSKNPQDIGASTWRELYPNPHSCRNSETRCDFLARKEVVHIAPKSYLCLQAGLKFDEYNAWTMWIWDDISITDLSSPLGESGFLDDGDVEWQPSAIR